MFSSSEEFETALISERRAQGRYVQPKTRWPAILFIGCALLVVVVGKWLRHRGARAEGDGPMHNSPN